MAAVTNAPSFWRRCSSCKEPIGFGRDYFVCSVSTCNRRATAYVFCSMACWGAHVPTLGHRDPWAEERRSPKEPPQAPSVSDRAVSPGPSAADASAAAAPRSPQPDDSGGSPSVRRRVPGSGAEEAPRSIDSFLGSESRTAALADRLASPAGPSIELNDGPDVPEDVLLVVSKLKAYIRARSGMNTSATVNDVLSDLVRGLCDEAIQQAAADERKTVMGRDFSGGL